VRAIRPQGLGLYALRKPAGRRPKVEAGQRGKMERLRSIREAEMEPYGEELILDLHNCDPTTFTRESIEGYFKHIADINKMERCDLHYWDYQDEPEEYKKAPKHLKGTSAIQFITTSDIRIHTLDILKKVFINIFTCNSLKAIATILFTENWFKGNLVKWKLVNRI